MNLINDLLPKEDIKISMNTINQVKGQSLKHNRAGHRTDETEGWGVRSERSPFRGEASTKDTVKHCRSPVTSTQRVQLMDSVAAPYFVRDRGLTRRRNRSERQRDGS